jgi:hypothetical protein
MTPDREFPAEVRGLLNHMFGELAGRARAVDWRQVMLEQLPDLLTHDIERYRCVQGCSRAGAGVAVRCWLLHTRLGHASAALEALPCALGPPAGTTWRSWAPAC